MSPPGPFTEGEGYWKRLNKAVPFEGPAFRDLEINAERKVDYVISV
jgi:hypothetical protein